MCRSYGLPREVDLIPRPVVIFRRVITDFDGERINRGKTYAEYLEEQRKRHLQPLQHRFTISSYATHAQREGDNELHGSPVRPGEGEKSILRQP